MATRSMLALVMLAMACRGSATSHEPDERASCFKVVFDDFTDPAVCDLIATTRVVGCFVDDGIELEYDYDLEECPPGTTDGTNPLLRHGDLHWHGRLGTSWALALARGESSPRWREMLAELDEIAAEKAGLGAPAPIVVIARGATREHFELRWRPLDRAADLVWTDGDRSGSCEIDADAVREIRAALRQNVDPEWLPTCPDELGYFMPGFALRSSQPSGCLAWIGERLVDEGSAPVTDPRLGEVRAAIATTLELLRDTASCPR